jgi:hypothetical protein
MFPAKASRLHTAYREMPFIQIKNQTIPFINEEKFVHKALKRSFRKMREAGDVRFACTQRKPSKHWMRQKIQICLYNFGSILYKLSSQTKIHI